MTLMRGFSRRAWLALGPLAAFCSTAWADGFDFTPDTTRFLSDPTFLTVAGQWYSETSAGRQVFNESWQPAGYGIVERYRADTDSYQQLIQYGVTNRLNVTLVGSYYEVSGHYTFTDRPAIDTSQSQFNDPELLVKYRAIMQTDDSVSLDLQLALSPGVVNGTPGSEGVAVFVNHQWQSLTLQAEGGATHYDSYTATDELNAATSRISTQWDYLLAIRSQLRASRHWAVNSGVVYTRNGTYSVTPSDGNSASSLGADSVIGPYVEVVCRILPRRLNLGFEYAHDFISDRSLSGAFDGRWLDQSRNLYTLRLRLIF